MNKTIIFLGFVSLFNISKSMIRENHLQFLNYDLVFAAENGDLKTIKDYYQKGGDLNKTDDTGNPILQVAVQHGHKNIVDFLISTGKVNLNSRCYTFQNTPLHDACEKANLNIVDSLMRTEVLVSLKNANDQTPNDIILTEYNKLKKRKRPSREEFLKRIQCKRICNRLEKKLGAIKKEKEQVIQAYNEGILPAPMDLSNMINDYLG